MKIVGFDFGTTNSVISLVRGNRVISFLDEEERPVPSVVGYEGGRKILGLEAKRRLAQAGLGVYRNIVRSPKMYLGRDGVLVDGTERSPVEMVADLVEHVRERAQVSGRSRGDHLGDIGGATVTIPVDMDGTRRRALRNAFQRAGLRVVQFVHEPFAALYGLFRREGLAKTLRRYDGKVLLVFDWGGGTLDLTLCRVMDGAVVQIRNDGTEEVGGDVFDDLLMNRIEQDARSSRAADAAARTGRGAHERLRERCERAKIDLSVRDDVHIHVADFFRGGGDPDLDQSLDRATLERIVGELLDRGFDRIERVLQEAGYSPEQVALCVATGGMSNMPAVRRRLHEWFGSERVRVPDGTATLVAEGAARMAADGMGLILAKNVELVLARDAYLPLVKAGTAMPKEGEIQKELFHLYCTDPRDGVAKFQICAPNRSGAAVLRGVRRLPLGLVTVKVDERARAFQERLELDVRINDDLILEAHARSLNAKDEDRCEIHDLEFGLECRGKDLEAGFGGGSAEANGGEEGANEAGAIGVRANLADRVDDALVPGEFLYGYKPHYFDIRFRPPAEQDYERLYYQPCAGCGRASNDPACRCTEMAEGRA